MWLAAQTESRSLARDLAESTKSSLIFCCSFKEKCSSTLLGGFIIFSCGKLNCPYAVQDVPLLPLPRGEFWVFCRSTGPSKWGTWQSIQIKPHNIHQYIPLYKWNKELPQFLRFEHQVWTIFTKIPPLCKPSNVKSAPESHKYQNKTAYLEPCKKGWNISPILNCCWKF